MEAEDVGVGMFDYYVPAGALQCLIDHHPLVSWQGKDGPRLLLLWREGGATPSHEMISEGSRLSEAALQGIRLPPTFTIYSFDCSTHHPLVATCATVEGVWSTTEIRKLGVYSRDDDDLRQMLMTHTSAQGGERERYQKPREFMLLDLATQMRFLPQFVRTWSQEQLFAWLRVWGEVEQLTGMAGRPLKDTYSFRSWAGPQTTFVLKDYGGLFIPVTSGWTWPSDAG